MAKRRTTRRHRIPKARHVKRLRRNRVDVTRAEYDGIIDVLNERNQIINALRDVVRRLEHADEVQLHRTAEIQQELDTLKRVVEILRSR